MVGVSFFTLAFNWFSFTLDFLTDIAYKGTPVLYYLIGLLILGILIRRIFG